MKVIDQIDMTSIFDLGYDSNLDRSLQTSDPSLSSSGLTDSVGAYGGGIVDTLDTTIAPSTVASGALGAALSQGDTGLLYSGKTSFTDTTNGYIMGIDPATNTFKFTMGTTGSMIDWNVTTANTLTISGALAAGTIDIGGSDATSFHVDASGNMWLGGATFATGTFSVSSAGAMIATTGTFAGFSIGTDYLRDAANTFGLASTVTAGDDVRFWAGAAFASRATAPFRITEAGVLTATSGDIAGWTLSTTALTSSSGSLVLSDSAETITVGSSTPRLTIDGANKRIRTSTYTSGLQGFTVEGSDGSAEFNNISVRGELHTSVLTYGEEHGLSGTFDVVKSAGKLKNDVTTLTSPSTFNVDIEDPDTGHVQLFAVNDIIRMKDGGGLDNWMTVSSASDQTTFWRYVCTKNNGTNGTFRAGAGVFDFGPSGQGALRLTADLTNSPYLSIFTHAGSPWSALTERVRLGNLSGITDTVFGALSGYGLWTDNVYLTGSVFASAGRFGTSTNYWAISSGVLVATGSGDVAFRAGQTDYNTGTGFWLGLKTGTAKFSIGDASVNTLTWDGTTLDVSGGIRAQKYFTTGIAMDAGSVAVIESDGLLYRSRASAFSTKNTETSLGTAVTNAYQFTNRLFNVSSGMRALFYSATASANGFLLKQIAVSPTSSTITSVTSTILDNTTTPSLGGDAVMVTASDAVVCWGSGGAVRARYVQSVDATVSLGTSISIGAFASRPSVVKVSATEVLVIYTTGGNIQATSVSISGTTLTAGSTYTILSNGKTNVVKFSERFGTSTAYAVIFNDTTDTKTYIMAFTFSGTTLTAGTKIDVPQYTAVNLFTSKSAYLCNTTSTQMGAFARFDDSSFGSGGDSVYIYTFNLSGTTLALGVQSTIENIGSVLANSNQVTMNKVSTYTYTIGYADSTTTTVGGLYRLASDTFSVLGSELTHTGITGDTAIPNLFCYYSPTRVLMVGTSSTSANGFAKTIDVTTNYSGTIGVITSATALSGSALVVLNGENTNQTGLVVGTEYYADLDGGLTTSTLGGTKRIGVTTATTKIIVQV